MKTWKGLAWLGSILSLALIILYLTVSFMEADHYGPRKIEKGPGYGVIGSIDDNKAR